MILGISKGFHVNGKRKLTNFEERIKHGIKIHTIREDINDRWHKGRKIHFATGTRTSQYNCFCEDVCVDTQRIEIADRMIIIDDKFLSDKSVESLAKNDGFDSVEDFWAWFDQYSPFVGKIIHWTGKTY